MKNIGEHLKSLRQKKNLTYGALGELSGVNASYISKIEKGKIKAPSADVLGKLAPHLGTTKQHLLEAFGYLEKADIVDLEEKKEKEVGKRLKVDLLSFLDGSNPYDVYFDGVLLSEADMLRFRIILGAMLSPNLETTFRAKRTEESINGILYRLEQEKEIEENNG